MKLKYLLLLAIGFTLIASSCVSEQQSIKEIVEEPETLETEVSEEIYEIAQKMGVIQHPIKDLEKRITEKPFGIYVEASPGQPEERFTGYHTGIDAEISKAEEEEAVPIYSVMPGKIYAADFARGYGGYIVIHHEFGEDLYTAIYGHTMIDSEKLEVGDEVITGQKIGELAEGYSPNSDGERKHLHFGLLPGHKTDIRGYVNSESELSGWINPIEFFSSIEK